MKAKDIMTTNVITVHQDAGIKEIAKVLIDNAISGVPVVDDEGLIVGIVSEGDLLHKETTPEVPNVVNIIGAIIYYQGVDKYNENFKKLIADKASSIMSRKLVVISEDAEIEEIARLMLKHSIKSIPVVSGKKIVGIVSRADMIKLLLSE